MAIRLCEPAIRSVADLGLPPVVEEFTRLPNGLILVTGPTGVGKTTTLNMMIDTINRERRAKVITIEDPVEFVHENCRSIIVQQEVQTDVHGEMRNLETIETALVAAETGHLVIATLHTPDSVQTIQRIQSVFPAAQQNFINVQLANSLQAIIAQKLLPRANGNGRVAACEICVATLAVRNKIRERQAHQLYSEMQAGRKHQMQTMDAALVDLYMRGEITYDMALTNAREPDAIRKRVGETVND
jgi:twitching motility protein PilT